MIYHIQVKKVTIGTATDISAARALAKARGGVVVISKGGAK